MDDERAGEAEFVGFVHGAAEVPGLTGSETWPAVATPPVMTEIKSHHCNIELRGEVDPAGPHATIPAIVTNAMQAEECSLGGSLGFP